MGTFMNEQHYAKLNNGEVVDITGFDEYYTYLDDDPENEILDGFGNGDKFYQAEDILFISNNVTDMFDDIVVSKKEKMCNKRNNILCDRLRFLIQGIEVKNDYSIELYGMTWRTTKEGYPKLEPVARKTRNGWKLL